MTIYVCCPPRIATGGVELLQQLVFELNKQYFGLAKILYLDRTPELGYPVPSQYEKYKNPFTINHYDGNDSVFILPEIWVPLADTNFKDHPTIIWWESVDNYFKVTPHELWYRFTSHNSMLHMTQSMYAKDFLMKKAGISENQIIEVSDYLNSSFLEETISFDLSNRKPNVLYNPAKGLDFTNKLIEAAPQFHWVPIANLSPTEVIRLMSESMVYIDFGDHPGKDRMPREAAICGCCIITGKNGSAYYYEDVPILDSYKFERIETNIPAICSCIEQVLQEYDEKIKDFSYYRTFIREEKPKFEKAVSQLITILLDRYSFQKTNTIDTIQEENEDVISITLYGTEDFNTIAKSFIEGPYNSYLQSIDPNSYKFKVKNFMVEHPSLSIYKGTPVISFETFIQLYKEQKVAALVIPTPAYLGQSFLITSLIQAGVDIQDIYCIEREPLKQPPNSPKKIAHFLTPYLDCPYLPYLEYHIVDHCNLNCKACEHYSPLVKEKKFTDYSQLKKDLLQLHSFISDIGIIRIMGGEPLLHKELKKFILLTRELYPNAILYVVTNALFVKQMDDELFYLMKLANCHFSISWYPPLKDQIETIKEFLEQKGVSYWISPLMKKFTMKQNLTGTSSQTEQFFHCLQAHCHNLYEGKIAACFLPFMTPYFNQTFQTEIPCDGALDLYQSNLTLSQIKQTLLTPMQRCKYCTSPPTAVAWKQANILSPCLEDWILSS